MLEMVSSADPNPVTCPFTPNCADEPPLRRAQDHQHSGFCFEWKFYLHGEFLQRWPISQNQDPSGVFCGKLQLFDTPKYKVTSATIFSRAKRDYCNEGWTVIVVVPTPTPQAKTKSTPGWSPHSRWCVRPGVTQQLAAWPHPPHTTSTLWVGLRKFVALLKFWDAAWPHPGLTQHLLWSDLTPRLNARGILVASLKCASNTTKIESLYNSLVCLGLVFGQGGGSRTWPGEGGGTTDRPSQFCITTWFSAQKGPRVTSLVQHTWCTTSQMCLVSRSACQKQTLSYYT